MPFRMLSPILRLNREHPRPIRLIRYLKKGFGAAGQGVRLDEKQRLIEWVQKEKQRVDLARKARWKPKKIDLIAIGTAELTERLKQTESVGLSVDEELRFRLENLLVDCSSESVSKFLDAIQLKPGELEASQLEIIFCLLKQLIIELNSQKIMLIDDSVRVLAHSSTFASILARSLATVDRLYPNCLIGLFEMLTLTKQEPQNELVQRVLSALDSQLDHLNVNQLCRCYKTANKYFLYKIPETQQLIDLKKAVLGREKKMLLRNEFDSKDEDAVIDHFTNFADFENDPNFQVVEHLAKVLLLPFVSLNFKQAVKIMGKVQPSYNFYTYKCKGGRLLHPELAVRQREKRLYPPILADLFEKCNTTIFEEFTFNLNAETFPYFLTKLHTNVSPLNFEFPDFYDQRLLSIISPWIVWNHEYRAIDYNRILRLVRNYSHFYLFDMKLLQLIYEKFCSRMAFKKFDAMSFYTLLAKFRWPFVDHQNAGLLARLRQSIESRTNRVRLLAHLVLNDVSDSNLLRELNETINQADGRLFRDLRLDDYKLIALARNYLPMFSQLDGNLRSELEHKFGQIINRLLATRQRPAMSFKYFRVDSRLTNIAYLSNGLCVDVFAIYDKSAGNLISLNEHRESLGQSFARVDQLRLGNDQEL